MSYQNLVLLQSYAQLVFTVCLFGGIAFLLAGLIRPRWVGFAKRRWVVLSTVGIWFLGSAIYGGAIAYTHSQPNGPHAFESYMDDWIAKTCIKNPAHTGCAALKKKCIEVDPTHPSCRILAGKDPNKFMNTTIRTGTP